mgnify:CR=1 FL=1
MPNLVWLCKGFEAVPEGSGSFGLLAHEVRAEVAPHLMAGVLSGPSFAQEVAQGKPTALVAASSDAALAEHYVTEGVARYTAAFTPPSGPLPGGTTPGYFSSFGTAGWAIAKSGDMVINSLYSRGAIAGGAVYRSDAANRFPDAYDGQYFFGV